MKFDADKGDRGNVFDADGVQIPYPIRGDTETGIVECYRFDERGRILPNLLPVTRRCKPPLEIRKTVAEQIFEHDTELEPTIYWRVGRDERAG